jgi:quercetin dioxygenase-like cupin family protein
MTDRYGLKQFVVGLCALGLSSTALADDQAMGRRVQELLHAHQSEIFGCVAAQKSAPRGEMLVRVIVGPDQHPGKAEILKDESGVPTLGACITAQITKPPAWDLTALGATAGDQVVFPLVFKPEPLAKGQKRNLVPMAAQETQGPNRYLLDDQSLGEAPLATMQIISVKPTESLPAKPAEAAAEEGVLYVLEGSFKLGADIIKPGDAIWLGAGTPRPGMLPLDKKPLRVVEMRAHGEGKGQAVVHAADAKSYPVPGGGTVKLLLDGTGAHLAVDLLEADANQNIPAHKHANNDEELYFVAGQSKVTIGKETLATAAGDALRIPAGQTHSVAVTEKLSALQVYAPGGPEQRFKGSAASDGGDEKPAAKAKKKK